MDGMYEVKEIPGKGKGLVATERIAKGTRLLLETPVFTVHRNSCSTIFEDVVKISVQRFTVDQRTSFFDLSNNYGDTHDNSLGIARTNALPLVGSDYYTHGLFFEASRINHSCRPNAHYAWNQNLGQMTIHAVQDINAAHEITISYIFDILDYEGRQSDLEEKFRFTCKCDLCLLTVDECQLSDHRRLNIWKINDFIQNLGFIGDESNQGKTLNLLRMMLDLFEKEGIWGGRIARAYEDAFDIAVECDDLSRAHIFATRAYKEWVLIAGEDSPTARNMKLAAGQHFGQLPEGLDEAELEDWL